MKTKSEIYLLIGCFFFVLKGRLENWDTEIFLSYIPQAFKVFKKNVKKNLKKMSSKKKESE